MKAVIMAGGFGTRIQPLTNSIPKPMLPIINKPMMEHIIKKLKKIGIKDFVILLYFKPEIIKDYFIDGKGLGINIEYVQPDDDYGTAGAVKYASEHLKDDSFIIVSGDLVTDFDLKQITEFHNEKRSNLTIALTSVEDPLQFGVVITDNDYKIEKFLEKPSWGEVFSDTINTGIYILEPEILDYIPEGENFDFGKNLFPKLMKENIELLGYPIEGYWRDVGNPQSYREVYEDILHQKVRFEHEEKYKYEHDNGVVYSEIKLNLSKIECKGIVVIGKNFKSGKNVKLENTVIGNNVVIDDSVTLANGVVWDNCKIGMQSNFNDFIICNDNNIGKKVKTKCGVIISEKCQIDAQVTFEKDVIVWPNMIVDENSVVSTNIIWGNKFRSTLFENGKVVGRTNIELSCEMVTKLAESFGTMLPVGSTVYVSRDYHKSSRMLKRVFLGGLLSAGINTVDLKHMPASIMRYNLSINKNIQAGIHIQQSVNNQFNTKIFFFTNEGLLLDNSTSNNIEKIFFKEAFRRVDINDIGAISKEKGLAKIYKTNVIKHLDKKLIKNKELKIAVDFMYGSSSQTYATLLNELDVETITINGHVDEKKLSKMKIHIPKMKKNLSKIVSSMNLDVGFLLYPGGEKIDIVCENGMIFEKHTALLSVLSLMNETAEKKKKVLLPVWAPDYLDKTFDNLIIERGRLKDLKENDIKKYDLRATGTGHFTFSEFAHHDDAVFASFKILEMLSKSGKKLSQTVSMSDNFYYDFTKIPCPNQYKGKMMRKFLEDSKGKEASHLDGVKIWSDKNDWILMIPDQYSDNLCISVQAENRTKGLDLINEYSYKIDKWIVA